ncbi:DNA-3-methyladenine glycosylase 2 family protein [Saccharopolyspora sp. NFXS83]|uniref:DNA-3-methyladenine glycosylase family protein n=1 Tax=Saccharopolyspora sp. NFXS83 TaxID=2993560 RepID=UPI00224A50CF|nr:DNA-3-methyladenine glycosylase 2 family protein [Saccharopolyspora sp. NFXS83]MCX2733895.1 DNA-3-methyladenine glycosylase 2 family protein [Saccharopolyspora sp. NFXS83]
MRTTWSPPAPFDLARVLSPLRRGSGDPTSSVADSGEWWLATTTAHGAATLRIAVDPAGEVAAEAWGDGAEVVLGRVPQLLGAADDDGGFVAAHEMVRRGRRAAPGMRLCSSGRVWDVLVAAVLEQKVTNREAWRSWRELCRRFGAPAPGPAPRGLCAPPTPRQVREIRDWEWHKAGVDGARRRTLIAAAGVAHRLERAVDLGGAEGRALLEHVPGIGPWTSAEVAQRAWGDPDAVSVGDYHLPTIVGLALANRPMDDAEMLDALAPYAGHRHRAVRYLNAAGATRPRFGPRLPARDYRTR